MSVGTTIDIIWMMMEAEMYGMTPMAKIDRRDSAPPENMLTIPRMVLERSPKKRATSAGFTPGTGMKVPMRYTTSAPIRKKKRLRISPKRAASLNAAAGLLMLVFAMPVLCSSSGLDLAAGGFDRRARALGHRHALERHRPGQRTGEHHLGALGAQRHDTRLQQRREIHQLACDLGQLRKPHLGAASLHGGTEADLGHASLQGHLAALEADLVVAALARALALGAAAAGLALAGGGAAAHAQARALASGSGPECVESHTFTRLSRSAAGARRRQSCRGSHACPPPTRSGECGAARARAPMPRCSSAARAGSSPASLSVVCPPWPSARDLFEALAALRRDFLGGADFRQRVHGGAHDVDRVARPVALGEHVAHAGALEHRAHAAAGDDAGAVGGWLHVHACGSMRSGDRVMQRIVSQRDVDEVLARLGHGLGNRHRNLTRLAEAIAHAAGTVAHHGERGEAELPAALDNLRGAIDGNEFLHELVRRLALVWSCHVCVTCLELETRFAGRICERLHAPVELEAGAVERHLAHPGGLGALGDGASHGLGGRDVAGALELAAYRLLHRGSRRDHPRTG